MTAPHRDEGRAVPIRSSRRPDGRVGRTSVYACQICRCDPLRAVTTVAGIQLCERHAQILKAIAELRGKC